MTRRGRAGRDSYYTRTLVIKPDSGKARDLFLSIGLPMVNEISVRLDTKPHRIELELIGEYDTVDRLLGKLQHLETAIHTALTPDRDGNFIYHNLILTKVFTPPVNLDLFAQAILVFGYQTVVRENRLVTPASFEEVREIHQRIVELRNQIMDDLNRDIERFVIDLALRLDTTKVTTIIDTALDLEVIKRTDYGYQFATDPEQARAAILDELGVELQEAVEIDEEELDELTMEDLLFDGGKVVFMRDGKEVDDPEFET